MPDKSPPMDLDMDVLVRRVRKLAKAYPLIQRITLHELEDELPRYLIAVEVENFLTEKPEGGFTDPVPADEIRAEREKGRMAPADPEKPDNFREVKPEWADLFKVINEWQADNFALLLGERFEQIYRPGYLTKMEEHKELEERRLRNGLNEGKYAIIEVKQWNIADEWMIELFAPGEKPIEVMDGESWLLFERPVMPPTEAVPQQNQEKGGVIDGSKSTIEDPEAGGDTRLPCVLKEAGRSRKKKRITPTLDADRAFARKIAYGIWQDCKTRTITEVAEEIRNGHKMRMARSYALRTIKNWIHTFHPSYEPGRRGPHQKK